MERWVIPAWPWQVSALIRISWQHLGCIPLLSFKRKSQFKKQFVTTGFALRLRCFCNRYIKDPAGTATLTTCLRCSCDRTAVNLSKASQEPHRLLVAGLSGGKKKPFLLLSIQDSNKTTMTAFSGPRLPGPLQKGHSVNNWTRWQQHL